ncbi:MAG: YmdB family metallophosphoesterase, partial [Selenomonadales bacterium]|nr:YmdB family metallophosphoesterase [Selenomonadales bacterium]
PSQTAYITDLGMVGAWNSILGVDKDIVIQQFRTGLPVRFKPATGEKVFCAVIIEFDEKSGKAISIERIKEILQ